jgi:hypothetical protein
VLLATLAVGCSRPPNPASAPAAAYAALPEDPFGSALAEGDRAWEAREEPSKLESALAAFRRAATLRPGDPGAELRLARAEALRAQLAPSAPESRSAWDAASRAGERALRARAPAFAAAVDRGDDPVAAAANVEPSGAELLYWLAVGRLRVAQATGPMAVMVTKDVVLGLLERVVALDERVDRAGPHRWLGALRAALPAAAGGGVARAREHFERARALAPADPFRPVLEAETLAVLLQDGTWFDALLAETTARDPAAERSLAAEIIAARRMAEALAARRAKLF